MPTPATMVKLMKALGMKAPQDDALEIARINAVKMLGLPENNTPMDRARALGFDVDVYHGSPKPDIKAFDPALAGQRGYDFGKRVYSTNAPDNASGYAINWEDFKKTARGATDQQYRQMYDDVLQYKIPTEGSTVYPLMVRSSDFYPAEAGGKNFREVNADAIRSADYWNFPGAKIKNVKDNAGRYKATSDVYTASKPEVFRSRFAAFDPARVNENNLLASRLLPFALPGLLAIPQDE